MLSSTAPVCVPSYSRSAMDVVHKPKTRLDLCTALSAVFKLVVLFIMIGELRHPVKAEMTFKTLHASLG